MKTQKLKVLAAAKCAGLFARARQRSTRAIRILCYHGIWLGDDAFAGDAMFMHAPVFIRRLELIREWGYPVISLREAVDALKHRLTLPPNSIVITIDDGWYGTYAHMLPALQRQSMPATLYCDTANLESGRIIPNVFARYLIPIAVANPTKHRAPDAACEKLRQQALDMTCDYDARLHAANELANRLDIDMSHYRDARAFQYMTKAELQDAHRLGLDVELHTHNHTLHDMSEASIAREILQNRASLSATLGRSADTFTHFCYPSGRANVSAARIMNGLGLASSTTTQQGLAWPNVNHHLIPRLLDNENLSELEFEAELSGFADVLRRFTSRLSRHPEH